ncbi:MAG: 23S rRNA pseudouridine(1911/1915/1917) synthase RluD [Propionivibrio sp.]|uniref:23S rRNA pseudouridine(1911/1915/1917) synthase RluD n=1 Tax=Propionivibrio sp. TaxID=2212460 RepID=UPI001B64E49D|nr:23S rRNA pseudouridine(1911/1915/1917) synthase RluD [Propionivibrio sp.]MBP7203688.1 23S rRNA pseudouridine(1911/1915/1917) synthase RluD [Propionivibrio sp.]
MKIPHKKTVVDTELGVPHATSGKTTDDGKKSADYSANASHALTVPPDCGGLRLDQALVRLWPKHSRNRLQNWIREGRVSVGGQIVSEPKHKLWGGESLELVEAPDEHVLSSAPEAIALNIVHEDDTLIVLDKPAGLVVHPGSGNWSGTLLNALLHHEPSLEMVPRAGIVHRLDKDTTGLMVVAKTLEAQTDLVRQLQARTVKRYYQALVRGVLEAGGTVDQPIGRHPTQRTKMAVVRTGKPARTHYRIVERFIDCTLVECALETGRTHQIRVHMTAIGHPLVGDPVYGGGASRVPIGPEFPRQALHARRLGLIHPATGKPMLWKSNMPDDMAELIETARTLAFEARALAEESDDDWDEDFADGPEIIYAYGDGSEDDDDID